MLIITPNRRLAAFSQRSFNLHKLTTQQTQNRVWQALEVLPLSSWLQELWQLCLESQPQIYRPVLSEAQQQILIEKVITETEIGTLLLRVPATAKSVIQAWTFMRQWQISLDQIQAYAQYSTDTAAFITWIDRYVDWLDQNAYIDSNLMVDMLQEHIGVIKDSLPSEVCLRGMQEIAPQYAALFDSMQGYGVKFYHDELLHENTLVNQAGFNDERQELVAAARWALANMQQNPNEIIAVVVPDLSAQRKNVANIFTAHIPEENLNISAPLPLANYMLVAHALLILQAAKTTTDFSTLSALLRSPYIGDAKDLFIRAQADRKLRSEIAAKTPWVQIGELIPEISAYVTEFMTVCEQNVGKQSASFWICQMQELLASWNWPGTREFTTVEADLLTCWREVLAQYAEIAQILPAHTYTEAVQLISRLVHETPFAPAETGATKIHVLGILEAEGLVFDKLWVTGMDRDHWPQNVDPNPYIPLEIQREFDMPKSTPQRELKVAQRLTANLKRGGQQVIFTYAQRAADHKLEISNLLADLAPISLKNYTSMPEFENLELERIIDHQVPMTLDATVLKIKSGVTALKLQAECPFKAYAHLRLNARPLEIPQLILTPAQRGNIVHAVLEHFWLHAKDSAILHDVTATRANINALIEQVLLNWQNDLPNILNQNYKNLEAIRLQRLLERWLDYEGKRESFKIKHVEHQTRVQVGPLSFSVRVDRIDELADQQLVIIDYKTGNLEVANWFNDPIIEPQLPIYAAFLGDQIVALVIADLQPAKVKFNGVAMQDDLLPDVIAFEKIRSNQKAANWHAQLQQWRNQLTTVAQEFGSGWAAVQPYSEQACRYCSLHALCRIYDN